MEKVLIGMSGGVDSSVAVLLLKNMGYEVGGITLKLISDGDEQSIADAKAVADKFSIPHYAVDFCDEFKSRVIDDFINEYKCGNTPNPCIACNKYIKFGVMLSKAKELGYTKIATGHYAIVEKAENGRYLLKRAKDKAKDQSYMLYTLSQEQLSHCVFPLGDLEKTEIREIAAKNGFINANKPDSQDICFVPDGDYASFIENVCGYIAKKGNYVDICGKILGEHKGIIHYTTGQRKGLGIALGKPQFVIDKNVSDNTVVLGDEEHLFKKTVWVNAVNLIAFDELSEPVKAEVKLRYRHNPADAVLYPEGDKIRIEFSEPQRAPTLGQAAVFYDGDIVIGGGIITRGEA